MDNSNDLHLSLVVKRLMITKISVKKLENIVVNHKSRLLKLNTADTSVSGGYRFQVYFQISVNSLTGDIKLP